MRFSCNLVYTSLLIAAVSFVTGCQGLKASPATTTTGGPQLTVNLAGTGSGTVTSNPAGISCPGTCSATFTSGATVSLSETPTTPNSFGGWSGGCTGTSACSLTLTASSSVTATFSTASLQSINHLIFFAQENRSFDHYFGYMRQYWANNGIPDQPFDGLPQFTPASQCTAGTDCTAPSLPGCDPADNGPACVPDPSVTVTSFHMQSVCQEELSPFWDEAHTDWNDNFLYPSAINPLMNGFVIAAANDARQYTYGTVNDTNGYRSMGYFTDADLNYYYFMASKFATSDRWFAPVMTRTQLNRAYIYAATSQGHAYPLTTGDSQFSAVPIVEALQNAGITWAIYVDADNTSCATQTGDAQGECLLQNYSYLNQFTYEGAVLATAGKTPDLLQNIRPVSQFATDIQNDATLPQVIIIEPASTQGLDEHPSDLDQYPENIQAGANYAAGLINSLMSSASWKDSALLFTYDEPGGFYDHVPAQTAAVPDQYAYPIDLQVNDACNGADQSSGVCSFGMTGYRIPMILISPFAKKNYVSHTVYDTTAFLALVEKRFGVQPLTARDAAQADMSTDFFDFTAPWATPPTPPAQNQGGTCSTAAPNPAGGG